MLVLYTRSGITACLSVGTRLRIGRALLLRIRTRPDLRLRWKLRAWLHFALFRRGPFQAIAVLHLKSLWAFAKGLLKAARECRREAVPKNSRHLINVEALGFFQQLLRRFHPDVPGIAANRDSIDFLKLPAHQRQADLKLLTFSGGAEGETAAGFVDQTPYSLRDLPGFAFRPLKDDVQSVADAKKPWRAVSLPGVFPSGR